MLHTIYAANGKVSHIHRRMCYWDYTEWITRSFVNKAKEGGYVKIQFIYLHIRTFPHEEQNHYKHCDPKYRCYSNGHYCTGWYRIRWQTCVEVACSVLNLNYVIVIYGGEDCMFYFEFELCHNDLWGEDCMFCFESELCHSDLWGNSMFSFEFELCHSNLWEEMAYSLLCLDRLDRKFWNIFKICEHAHFH